MGPGVKGYDVQKTASEFQKRVLAQIDEFAQTPDQPFFFYIPSHLVHGPVIPDKEFQGTSGAGAYGDFVLQFDAYVGQVLDALDRHGLTDNTNVILTSDNGVLGVAGLSHLRSLGHDPSNGYPGHKTDIWEGGHREPTIVRWPGHIEANSVSARTVAHCDVFRTLADLLEHDLPETAAEDSISNLPLWMGRDVDVRADLVNHSGGGGFAIRRGAWKLELVTSGDGMDAQFAAANGGYTTGYEPAQLYNLDDDPSERRNIIRKHPEIVDELMSLLADQIRQGRSTPGAPQTNGRNNPTGQWPQLAWLEDFREVEDASVN